MFYCEFSLVSNMDLRVSASILDISTVESTHLWVSGWELHNLWWRRRKQIFVTQNAQNIAYFKINTLSLFSTPLNFWLVCIHFAKLSFLKQHQVHWYSQCKKTKRFDGEEAEMAYYLLEHFFYFFVKQILTFFLNKKVIQESHWKHDHLASRGYWHWWIAPTEVCRDRLEES